MQKTQSTKHPGCGVMKKQFWSCILAEVAQLFVIS